MLALVLLAAKVILPDAAALLSSSIDPVPEPVIPSVAVPEALTLKLELVTVRALDPTLQVEAALPVILSTPAEVSAKVPEVVVDTVRFPPVLLTVNPLAPGPVRERAAPAAVKIRSELIDVTPRLLRLVLA